MTVVDVDLGRPERPERPELALARRIAEQIHRGEFAAASSGCLDGPA